MCTCLLGSSNNTIKLGNNILDLKDQGKNNNKYRGRPGKVGRSGKEKNSNYMYFKTLRGGRRDSERGVSHMNIDEGACIRAEPPKNLMY